MIRRIGASGKGFLGTLGLLGTLLVIAALTLEPSAGAATAAPGGPISGKQATSVAQKTEQLHAAHAKMAAADEDGKPLLHTSAQTLLSPEQAMDLVQKSGLAIGPVSSVDLRTDAGGRQIYEVRTDPLNRGVIQVDAQTGVIVVPGPPAP